MEILRDLLGKSTSQGRIEWIGIADLSRGTIQESENIAAVAESEGVACLGDSVIVLSVHSDLVKSLIS